MEGKRDKDPPHWRLVDRPDLKVQIQWEPRDVWIGLFWRKTGIALHFYICILPMVPLHITVKRWRGKWVEGDYWCSLCDRVVKAADHRTDHIQYLRMRQP